MRAVIATSSRCHTDAHIVRVFREPGLSEDLQRESAAASGPLGVSVRFVSDDVADVLGYAPHDFYSDSGLWLSAVHPDDLPGLQELTRSILASQVPGVRRYRMRHRDTGDLVWMEDVVSPQLDSSGRIAIVQGFARDVQGREPDTGQPVLITSAVDQTADCVFITDAAGVIIYANRAVEAMTGYGADELIGATPALFKSGEHDAGFYRSLWDTILAGRVFRAVFTNREKSGEVFYEEMAISPVRNADGTIAHFVSTGRDITERRRGDEAQSASELRYRRLFEAAKDGILILDAGTGAVVDVNPFLVELLGYSRETFLGKLVWELGFLIDTIGNLEQFSELRRTGYVRYEHLPLKALDGRSIDVEFVSNVYAEGGREVIQCNIRDITERRQADDALKASESLLRFQANLLQSVGEAVIATDLNGAILFWNKAAERIYGWKSEEVIGRNILDVTPAEQSSGQVTEIMSALVAGQSWEGEFAVRHRDGHSFPAMVTDTAILDDTGQVAGIIGVSSDISERRSQEDKRLAAQDDLATTLDAIPDLLFEVGLDGRYYAYHSPREDLLAVPPEELLGRTLSDVLPAAAAATCMAALREAHEGGRSTGKQFELDLPQGTLWFELSVSRKPVAAGQEPRFIVLSRDVTERKRAEAEREALEAQLRQSQKMESVGQLAGGIAHDFNNLLNVITGTAYLVSEQLAANDPLHEDVRAITEAADRAVTMTRQLLAFSRKQIMQLKVLDLSALVLDLEGMLRRLISADVDLGVVAARGSDSIRADPGQIEQVVVNLAVNARDAMPTGGALTITVEAVDLDGAQAGALPPTQPGPHVMLTVSDTGTGMDEATIARLFEPFFTTKGVGKGTGLGLPTVYGIVQQSGGAIWVDSEVGKGTSFRIWFPRVDEEAHAQQAAPKVVSQRGAETILVVEDYDGLRMLARRMLEKVGYTVLVAGNGTEALRVLEGHDGPLHLVLTDVVMPGMGGRDLAARITEARPETRVIYTSGYTDDALIRQGVDTDAAHFLSKPYTQEDLTRTVRTVLDAG